jgi:carbamoyl-phosphate synthase small subunit
MSLPEYLAVHNVMGIEGIDTRELVTKLRISGAQMAFMAAGDKVNPDDLVDHAKAAGSMEGKDYVKHVTCKEPYTWDYAPWDPANGSQARIPGHALRSRPHVVAIDCGVKTTILSLLVDVGFRVTVVPAGTPAAQILSFSPDALFLSNGPGDPATLDYVVNPVREILGKIPVFGICLGHQILAQALGGKTYKLKFGHRGGNHPVRDQTTGKVEITVQNHGFAVDRASVEKLAHISHLNLNDHTVEGIEVNSLRAFSVQHHPEASPGPHDSRYLFERFYRLVTDAKK